MGSGGGFVADQRQSEKRAIGQGHSRNPVKRCQKRKTNHHTPFLYPFLPVRFSLVHPTMQPTIHPSPTMGGPYVPRTRVGGWCQHASGHRQTLRIPRRGVADLNAGAVHVPRGTLLYYRNSSRLGPGVSSSRLEALNLKLEARGAGFGNQSGNRKSSLHMRASVFNTQTPLKK